MRKIIENSENFSTIDPEFSKRVILKNNYAFNRIFHNKRGMSQIIATVLLILLTVSAATFIASFIFKFISGEMDKTKCNEYVSYFNFENEFGYNCFENINGNKIYKISIGAKNVKPEISSEVAGFGIIFFSEGNSKVIEILNGTSHPDFKMLSDPSSTITIPYSAETRSYNYSNSVEFSSAKIYAILKTRKCGAVESTSLRLC